MTLDPRLALASGDMILGGGTQRHLLIDANVPSKPVIVSGGTYLLNQLAGIYGTVTFQVLAADNATWNTALTFTSSDSDGGTELKLGAQAIVRATATSTTGAFMVLARVPA